MDEQPWPFDQPRNCAVFSNRSIIIGGESILFVSHDIDDNGWQFLNGKSPTTSDAAIVALGEIVARDPSVIELADMPPGWTALRDSPSSPWNRSQKPTARTYPCSCCGYEVFSAPPGSREICPICCWQDDAVQLAFPDMVAGANKCSLIEGQDNFAMYGACELHNRDDASGPQEGDVRDPYWRPLSLKHDRYLDWSNEEDCQLWHSVKDSPSMCLYYWLSEYWLLNPAVKRGTDQRS